MRAYVLCLLTLLIPTTVHAVVAEQKMRTGIPASAEYLIGERDKPAVLLLHGFLQTREFPTVATLARGLHDAGYSVLTPTLSLGIPYRKQSLACEAVHKHGLDDDISEIGRWVAWLKSQDHRKIVLVGHSFGSLQLLAYLANKPDAAVKAYIGASLIEAQIGNAGRGPLIADLESRSQRNPRTLVSRPLSFCHQYLSTPASLLTYVRWDQARILATLKQAPVETYVIMGDSDEMVEQGWLKALQHVQVSMAIVKGANHFMDGTHEFDLLEHTLKFLQDFKAPSR